MEPRNEGDEMKINLLVLRTSRLEDLRRFYSDLGAKFQSEKHGNGPEHYAATISDDFVLELYPILDGAIPDNGLRLGLKVDDIEKILRSLSGHSVKPQCLVILRVGCVRSCVTQTAER
jgi:hypothetical protein